MAAMPLLFEWPFHGVFVGAAALLAGGGSFLSGLAAYRIATRRNDEPKRKSRGNDH